MTYEEKLQNSKATELIFQSRSFEDSGKVYPITGFSLRTIATGSGFVSVNIQHVPFGNVHILIDREEWEKIKIEIEKKLFEEEELIKLK